MLRSLVGSEMCIRDRDDAAQAGGHHRGLCGSSPHVAQQGEGHLDEVGPCLLYTSDAADDLLCVDLGGRRITKKKTLTPHN